MTKKQIAIHTDHSEVHFTRNTAARLARVSVEFIRRCEHEDLVKPRVMIHGRKGLCCEDVARLKYIRHLHEDLGLNLEAIDFVMRYRDHMATLQQRLRDLEQHMRLREKELLSEIHELRRRLAMELDWD